MPKLFVTDAIKTLFIPVKTDQKSREVLKEHAPYLDYDSYKINIVSEIKKVDDAVKISTSDLQLGDFWVGLTLDVLKLSGFQGDPKKCAQQLSEVSWGMPDLYVMAEGSKEVLEYAKEHGLKLALLSNQDARLNRFLEYFNLQGVFDDVYISALRGVEKPNPLFYKMPLSDFGIDGKDTLYLDDSRKAIVGGIDAGYGTCLLYNPKKESELNESVSHWNQLYKYIE